MTAISLSLNHIIFHWNKKEVEMETWMKEVEIETEHFDIKSIHFTIEIDSHFFLILCYSEIWKLFFISFLRSQKILLETVI